MDPNSFDKEIKDAQANPDSPKEGTEGDQTPPKTTPEGEPAVDYKTKFAESSQEAIRLLHEKEELEKQLAAKANSPSAETVYPGFEELDPEAQKNLIAYTNVITKRTKDEIYKDPAIAYASKVYNESKWDQAFNDVVVQRPELKDSRQEFKSKYFNPKNTPDNIKDILGDLAKIYLFDKAKDIGAKEEKAKQSRVDLERTTGGDKTPQSNRTLEDWTRMAQSNPAEFAKHSKEYNTDLASGKLKE